MNYLFSKSPTLVINLISLDQTSCFYKSSTNSTTMLFHCNYCFADSEAVIDQPTEPQPSTSNAEPRTSSVVSHPKKKRKISISEESDIDAEEEKDAESDVSSDRRSGQPEKD